MSPSVMTDSPFLETKLKLSNGELYQVPQIILNSVRSRVVEQYQTFCRESGISDVASDRSYMRILQAIEPNIRKSMKGLDNYAADGAKGIDDLKKIVNVLGKQLKGKEWEDGILLQLSNCKQYLKLDYKMHISLESEIPDHCCQFALSSDSGEYSVACSHSHDAACANCNDLYHVIEGIKQAAGEVEFESEDQKDDIQYSLSQSVKALEEWKKHLLRSVNQDRARSHVIENLSDGEVLIERDWAMKLLPMMYRESQSKWFAKRGMNWHITVGTYIINGVLHSHTIVHIFDNANQDAVTSNAILKDSVLKLKEKNQNLTKAFIRSDNAGCFHSVEAFFCIPLLNQVSALKVVQVDFADPQGGKSICDRRAAHIKGSIRNYVNEGNNVTTSNEFLSAVIKSNIKNVQVVTTTPPCGIIVKKAVKIKDITTLNNFQYHDDHVLAFKQYQIGKGVKIINTSVHIYDNFPSVKILKSNSTDDVVKVPKPIAATEDINPAVSNRMSNDNDTNTQIADNSSFIFTCPEPHCLLTFMRYGNLSNHLDKGDHQCKTELKSLSDKSKVEYVRQIDTKQSMLVRSSINPSAECSTLVRGWALKNKRSVKRFSSEQIGFLKEMFQKGEMTGHKYDPEEVSVMMRTIKKNGKRRFSQDLFLTPSQISSFFSRLSIEKRKSAQNSYESEDFVAEEYENNIIDARSLTINMN